MIRTERYEFAEKVDTSVSSEERLRRVDFNRRFTNALEKAKRVNPEVIELTADSFRVTGEEDEYLVRLYTSDGRDFAHCTCDAGTYNQPCYHALQVIVGYDMPSDRNPMKTLDEGNPAMVFTLMPGQSLPEFFARQLTRITVEVLNQ